jgi:hypothetical protein
MFPFFFHSFWTARVLPLAFFVISVLACTSSPTDPMTGPLNGTAEAKPQPTLVVPQTIRFAKQGKVIKTLSLEQMQKISGVRDITVIEPHMKVAKTYQSMPLVPILDSVYGKKWRQAKDIEWTCRDGYQPIYSTRFYAQFNPYLAFSEKGSERFEIQKPMENNATADLAPFYVVWDYARHPKAESMGLSAWVYQVVGIDMK